MLGRVLEDQRPVAADPQAFPTVGGVRSVATEANLAALADLSGAWIDRVHQRRPPDGIVLDMDSSESPAFGQQGGSGL